MTERVKSLRSRSLEALPSISTERARLMTEFYKQNDGKHSIPIMRALSFLHLCENKTIWIGDGELIVGERGPEPKATPTFPELTCHSVDDLDILNCREKTSYVVPKQARDEYAESVIPYWRGRTMRDRLFEVLPSDWQESYEAGIFTEFMEQRAPGHTVADGKIYIQGLNGIRRDITMALARLDFEHDPQALDRREELLAMEISIDACIHFAKRHADLASEQAKTASPTRKAELERIAEVCNRVPGDPPRDYWEALQAYWFCHLAVITELNGWDSFSPGRLDQHLNPFFQSGIADGSLDRESAKELLECFFVKFNNHPAPPKVGVTAAESGTYTDFANINIGGLTIDGTDGSNDVSYLLLDVIEEMHILQPSNNVQLSRQNPDAFLRAACRVIRHGYGFPSVFNADSVIMELVRQGKSIEDARQAGTSGCVEAGTFGKEAYILTGYFNLPKILELTLHDGIDPRTGKRLGPATGKAKSFASFEALFKAWQQQVRHFVDVKIRGSQIIERMFAKYAPAPFLSVLIDDCISKGLDYNAGGARYNTSYIQGVGIGTVTDSFSAIKTHVFDRRTLTLPELLDCLANDCPENEPLRARLINKTPRYGNDDDEADAIMRKCFDTFFHAVDGRPNTRGGEYHIDMLPTTCHVYFGSVTGATPDGRRAWTPLSEGISPVQGADRLGPTAVLRSAGKMDHLKTGGTLLNMKFSPNVLANEDGIARLVQLVRGYFRLSGHHIQFNVVDADLLREAQRNPEEHRDLIVRVAGYSDYFCDLGRSLQDEIIARTEHESVG
ncbi:MAG: glycyl radical protein [Fimbriimonas sp.]|nr:glycyl radical protein [Fimbriimonas sp.]